MTTYQRLAFIRKPDLFTDTLTAAQIAGIEASAVDHEDFVGGMLSQLNRVIGATNWHDNVADTTGDPRSLKALTDDLYYKDTIRWRQVAANVTVTAAQNYEVLVQASSETPGEVAAVNAGSASGAIVATLAGDVGSHALTEVAGLTATFPKNLCLIRDAATQDPILSDSRQVYALLQAETGVVDGDAFDDTTKQAQLSFVRQTSAGTDLEAVPAGDIAGKTINYQYQSRTELRTMNEQDFLFPVWRDPQAAQAVTLQDAYLGGNTISVLTAEGDLIVNLSQDTTEFEVQRGGSPFLTLTRNDTTGDVFKVDADQLDVNLTTDADFSEGIKADTAGTTINVGVTAGQVDATALEVEATAGDLSLVASADIEFTDARDTALPLTDATAGSIAGLPGGPYASISAAIRAALTASDIDVFVQVLTSNYAQDANVPGSGNGDSQDWSPALDLSSRSIDMNSPAGVDTIIVYNGSILYGGNGSTNNDVYAGTTPANGDLAYDFSKGVKTGDVVLAFSWASG